MILGDAFLNTTFFIGGSYLAKYFSGDDSLEEKKRYERALERYKEDYAKYQENLEKNSITCKLFHDIEEAFKLYNIVHQEKIDINEPVFSDYYRPSKDHNLRR